MISSSSITATLALLARVPLVLTTPNNPIPILEEPNHVLLEESDNMHQPSKELLSIHKQLQLDENSTSLRVRSPINIDVYINVITGSDEGQNKASVSCFKLAIFRELLT